MAEDSLEQTVRLLVEKLGVAFVRQYPTPEGDDEE